MFRDCIHNCGKSHEGINLTEDVQNLFGKNYKILWKDIKEDIVNVYRWKTQYHKGVNSPLLHPNCSTYSVLFYEKS